MGLFEDSAEAEYGETEIVTLYDDEGQSLDCYIENAIEIEDEAYLLLSPVDSPIVILAWNEEDMASDEATEAEFIEDASVITELFPLAKAVLAEQNLSLKRSAFTLTASGELPAIDEEQVLTLELAEEDRTIEPEELQFLAYFYHVEQKYAIYTPLTPLLFVAREEAAGKLTLLSPEQPQLQEILQELLFTEFEDDEE